MTWTPRAGGAALIALAMITAPRAHPALPQEGPRQAARPPVIFEDVTASAGLDMLPINGSSPEKYLVETMGSGGLFFDADNDGWIDIFLVDGGSLADRRIAGQARDRLFRNRGNGTFADVTAGSGIEHHDYGMGACAADYDNDGLVDLYVTGAGRNTLYHNEGGAKFRDVTNRAGVQASQWSTSCAFADVDRDGKIDLFVTRYVDAEAGNNRYCGDPARKLRVYCHPLNYQPLSSILFHNNGDGTFSDASARAGIAALKGNGLGVVVGDYDNDGWPDIFVANDSMPNFLFHNDGGGVFHETALFAGVSVADDGKPRAGMGTDFGDYDGDGLLDLVVTNHEFERTTLFRNLGKGLFADATGESGLGPPTLAFVGFGTAFFDYDNDGRLDVAIANGHVIDNTALVRPGSAFAQPRLLFHNEGARRFVEVGRQSGAGFAAPWVGRTLVVGDIDNDGDLDILVTGNGQRAALLRNDGGNRQNSIEIALAGRMSNRAGVGARVTVTAGSAAQIREARAGSSYLGQNDSRLHFGLGGATVVDRLEIKWPGGTTTMLSRVPAGAVVTVTEGQAALGRAPFRK